MPKSGKISKQIHQNVIGGGFGGSWGAGSAPGGSGAKALKPKVDFGAENWSQRVALWSHGNPKGVPKSSILTSNYVFGGKSASREGFQKKHEKSMKNGSENAMFWEGKTF